MTGTQLSPEKITSPFQLMAAWFAMLVLLISVLLTAAANITHPEWASGYLVVFASIVVLVVIACVILMLTKFRPNLQEGKEYSEWLKDKNTYSSGYLIKDQPQSATTRTQQRNIRSAIKASGLPNKGFLISVANVVGSQTLVESLKNLGFNVELYQEQHISSDEVKPRTRKKSEGIWVGSRVDPKAAIQAIKVAASLWSELKYLHLSSDGGDPPDYVHDQLFLGGATSAAKRYGLQEWSQDELLALDDEMPLEAFHSAIRAKYS